MTTNDIQKYLYSCFSDTPNTRYLEKYESGFFTRLSEEIKKLPLKLSFQQECNAYRFAFSKSSIFAGVDGLPNNIRGESVEIMEKLLNVLGHGPL